MDVEIICFYVGAGDCTLLCFRDDNKKMKHTVLMDCGSNGGSSVTHRNDPPGKERRAREYLRERIGAYLKENDDVLDYLLISHPDKDHYNWLHAVLCHDDTKRQLQYTVKNLWYSCDRNDYRNENYGFISALLDDVPPSQNRTTCDQPGHVNHGLQTKARRIFHPSDKVPLFKSFGDDAANAFVVAAQQMGPLPDSPYYREDIWLSLPGGGSAGREAKDYPYPGKKFTKNLKSWDIKKRVTELKKTIPQKLAGAEKDARVEAEAHRLTFDEMETTEREKKIAEVSRYIGRAESDGATHTVKVSSTDVPRWVLATKVAEGTTSLPLWNLWVRNEARRQLGVEYRKKPGGEAKFQAHKTKLAPKEFLLEPSEYKDILHSTAVKQCVEEAIKKAPNADQKAEIAKIKAQLEEELKEYNDWVRSYNSPPVPPEKFPERNWDDTKKEQVAKERLFRRSIENEILTWQMQERSKEVWANLHSMVVVVQGPKEGVSKRQQAWIMGDSYMLNEDLLRLQYKDSPFFSDASLRWLRCGHHGSETSTSDEWVDFLKPAGIFISAGPRKSFRHPWSAHWQKIGQAWDKTKPADYDPPDRPPGVRGPVDPHKSANPHHYVVFAPKDGEARLEWRETRRALGTTLYPDSSDTSGITQPPKKGPAVPVPTPEPTVRTSRFVEWHLRFHKNGQFELWFQ